MEKKRPKFIISKIIKVELLTMKKIMEWKNQAVMKVPIKKMNMNSMMMGKYLIIWLKKNWTMLL